MCYNTSMKYIFLCRADGNIHFSIYFSNVRRELINVHLNMLRSSSMSEKHHKLEKNSRDLINVSIVCTAA